MTSGKHLSAVRSWIQWHAVNGSDVTWSSQDVLQMRPPTVMEMENLAQEIADAVLREGLSHMNCCDSFGPWGMKNGKIRGEVCINCGVSQWWHDQKVRLC